MDNYTSISMRAEIMSDAARLLAQIEKVKALAQYLDTVHIQRQGIFGARCDIVFQTWNKRMHEALKLCFRKVDDSHVMEETIAFSPEYNGERRQSEFWYTF